MIPPLSFLETTANDLLTGLSASILFLKMFILLMARNILKTKIKPTHLKLDYITLLLKCHQWVFITFSIKSKFPTMTYKALYDLASAYFADFISYHFLLCLLTSVTMTFFLFLKHGNLFLSTFTGFSKEFSDSRHRRLSSFDQCEIIHSPLPSSLTRY